MFQGKERKFMILEEFDQNRKAVVNPKILRNRWRECPRWQRPAIPL